MLFNSIQFLLYFVVVLGLYFLPWERPLGILSNRLRGSDGGGGGRLAAWLASGDRGALRLRQVLLLLASYYFYMCWRPEYALLILLSTVIDYFAALLMEACPERRGRRKYLIVSLLANLGLLFSFKYFNFFNQSLRLVFEHFGATYSIPSLRVLLPVGISFYTFQTLGYSIDVYRGDKKAERDFIVFALYVSFFPQLVAGPIERSRRLIPQFHQRRTVDWSGFVRGFSYILWGYFMKLVIADQIAPYVNRIFAQPENYSGGHYIVASALFAYQVFGDFAGYSAIAIGTAAMMGYSMMQNFRRPFFATNMTDFWGRWHVSLMTWLRDYVYRALRVKDSAGWRLYMNLLIIYLLSGLWHGAAWTFVAWGLVNWIILAVERAINEWPFAARHKRPKWMNLWGLTRALECLCVFFLFSIPAIFFRAPTIAQALAMYRRIFEIPAIDRGYLASLVLPFTSDYSALALALAVAASLVLLEGVHLVQEMEAGWIMRRWQQSTVFRGTCLASLMLIILLFGNFDSQSFLYFQF